ncbi:hypothetical protein ROTO_33160 [Roseovarius tolerans]|uniref:Uncharacterized protein n=1 Tax=Roseovarius tolerans TaxID=74031 RepID=A0A0L6CQX8_9RHOB|nr:hypothetical protein [Roseovarius tolerans]KNX40157.1 hypothetical protein ROTO_33160 [Roseovarius tolerans]
MLRLNLAREPYWLDLGLGVRVLVEPLTTALMVAARSDPAVRGLPEGTSDDEIAVIFGKVLADRAILDWEGVGDADGNPTPVTPEGIAALLDMWPIFERFQMGYVAKGLELEQEKNASAPSPTGATAGAKATAPRVRKTAKTARK